MLGGGVESGGADVVYAFEDQGVAGPGAWAGEDVTLDATEGVRAETVR